MGLFTLFRKKEQETQPQLEQETRPTISEGLFTSNEQPADPRASMLPLYRVYSYIEADLETRGYKDALEFPDNAYARTQMGLIKDDIRLKIEIALVEYDDLINELDAKIEAYRSMALIESLHKIQSKKSTYLNHIEILRNLDKDISNESGNIQRLVKTYEVGFQRGIVETLNN